ncbi:MAG: SDR family oxidoreductase [Planctomycetota bacterium]
MAHESKTVLITGTSSGFGRGAAESLARKGHTVYASMRGLTGKNKAHADELAALAERDNLKLHPIELDVTDEAQVNSAVESIVAKEGRLDAVVNNAGIGGMGVTESFSLDQARAMYETNVFGPLALTKAALPAMRKQKSGLVVNISSGLGRFTMPGIGIYASTKWALEALSESLRYEGSAVGVDTVIIEPGAFKTGFLGNQFDPADADRAADYGPLGDIEANMTAGIQGYFESEHYTGSEAVVDAIVEVIETPQGSRPLRVAVGGDMGPVAEINEQTRGRQQQLLEAFGMKDFAPLA